MDESKEPMLENTEHYKTSKDRELLLQVVKQNIRHLDVNGYLEQYTDEKIATKNAGWGGDAESIPFGAIYDETN